MNSVKWVVILATGFDPKVYGKIMLTLPVDPHMMGCSCTACGQEPYADRTERLINEALGTGRVSNISEVQTPTPANLALKKAVQELGGLAAGGVVLGLGAVAGRTELDRELVTPPVLQPGGDFGTDALRRRAAGIAGEIGPLGRESAYLSRGNC